MKAHKSLVYVIDDDDAVRDSLAAMLTAGDYATRCFSTAEELLDVGIGDDVDYLVVDVRLPGKSGVELLQSLARDGRTVPAALITGHVDGETLPELTDLKSVSLHTKPCDPNKLCSEIEHAIGRTIRRVRVSDARGSAESV